MSEKKENLIEVDLDNENTFVLPTPEDAQSWLESYEEKWGWAQSHRQGGSQPINQAAQQITNFIVGLRKPLTQLEANPQQWAQTKKNLENHFRAHWTKGWQSDSDPKAQFVLETKNSVGDVPALMALAYFLDQPFQLSQLDKGGFIALLNAAIFDQKLAELKPATKAAITKSVAELEDELSKLREQRKEHDESWTSQLQTINDTLSKHDQNLQDLHDTRAASLDQFVEETKADIEAFKKAHREEINLKEPVTFWAGKQRRAFWSSIVLAVVFAGGLYGAGQLLVTESKAIYEGLKLGDPIEYWRVAGMILLGGLAFWFLRILSKIFLSQLHAWSDAQERVVMVKTYLSLLQDEKALESKDRRLILEALFRPAPSGIIKDDGVPPALFDLISRLK
ncbi:MAG: DUF6161 domain-containing protein [Verrucomicrobiota bacterium JB023]|nr:DUF6161 domain-containing protein [Verrucomicrobiota bacterium JB023]